MYTNIEYETLGTKRQLPLYFHNLCLFESDFKIGNLQNNHPYT